MKDVSFLLKSVGYPTFDLDGDGFPLPGQVIRYFREQMKYDDGDGKQKHWTQTDLAKRLGVSEVTVRLMETKNTGLDSIARRRLLSDMLKIPPTLLGLGSLADLAGFLAGKEHTSSLISHTTHVSTETLSLYRDASLIYGEQHLTSTAQDSLSELDQWTRRIQTDIKQSPGQQAELLDTLWNFYDLIAKVHSDDFNNWEQALSYLNEEMKVADALNSDVLRAASLYRSGQIRFAQRQYYMAQVDLDGAVTFIKPSQQYPQLKGAIFASASLAHAIVSKDEKSQTYAQKLITQSGDILSSTHESADPRFVKFDYGKYLIEYADTLIALRRPSVAIDVLDDASEQIDTSLRRRQAYINILQAEASMRLKKPKLDVATDLLAGAFTISSSIKSVFNIGHIHRRYTELRSGSYGNSTAVADLGSELRAWKKLTSK